MMTSETPQVYLVCGTDEVKIHKERARLIADFVPREHRAGNLTEIEPPGNRPLLLRQIAADLMAELATPSFFPDTHRVVAVEQLADLLGSPESGSETDASAPGRKPKTKQPGGADLLKAFCRFLENDLRQIPNILILSAIEEPEKRRRIRTNSPLYQTIKTVGRILQFNQPAIIFRFLDAFGNRDLAGALRALPELLAEDEGAGSVFRMLIRQVRFLIQAKLLEHSRIARKDEADQFAAKYFPPEKGLNLMLEHSYVFDKTRQAAGRWSLAELNVILARLERLIKVAYPSSADVYVPDIDVELEYFVLDACGTGTRTLTHP